MRCAIEGGEFVSDGIDGGGTEEAGTRGWRTDSSLDGIHRGRGLEDTGARLTARPWFAVELLGVQQGLTAGRS